MIASSALSADLPPAGRIVVLAVAGWCLPTILLWWFLAGRARRYLAAAGAEQPG